jgi:hypothetical protein
LSSRLCWYKGHDAGVLMILSSRVETLGSPWFRAPDLKSDSYHPQPSTVQVPELSNPTLHSQPRIQGKGTANYITCIQSCDIQILRNWILQHTSEMFTLCPQQNIGFDLVTCISGSLWSLNHLIKTLFRTLHDTSIYPQPDSRIITKDLHPRIPANRWEEELPSWRLCGESFHASTPIQLVHINCPVSMRSADFDRETIVFGVVDPGKWSRVWPQTGTQAPIGTDPMMVAYIVNSGLRAR